MPRDIPESALKHHSGPHPMENLPAKYSHALERNQLLNLCCRHMENVEAVFYESPTATEGKPDIMIATCKECNRRHWRMAAGGMKMGV